MSNAVLQFPTPTPTYASAPESAKLLKAALRAAFPATKFSVTLSRGTGYGYCHVKWTDGPTPALVNAICAPFEGSTFDSMQDMSVSTGNTLPDGRRTGLRGISTGRTVSIDLARRCAEQVNKFWGVNIVVTPNARGNDWVAGDSNGTYGRTGYSAHDLIWQAASDRTRFTFKGAR